MRNWFTCLTLIITRFRLRSSWSGILIQRSALFPARISWNWASWGNWPNLFQASLVSLAAVVALLVSTSANSAERYLSINDFGALCDGVTDDRRAFQEALDAGQPVIVPYSPTPCVLHGHLYARGGSSLIGENRKPTILIGGSHRNTAFLIVHRADNVEVRSLIIDGNHNDKTTKSNLIRVSESHGFAMENVEIRDAVGRVLLRESTSCSISDSHFENGMNSAIEIEGSGSQFNVIKGCTFENNRFFGIRVSTGAHHNILSRNRTKRNGLELIGLTFDTHDNTITENHAEGTGDNGISVSGYRNIVSENFCQHNAMAGIYVFGSENTIFSNVLINNNQDDPSKPFCGICVGPFFGGKASRNVVAGNIIVDDQVDPTQYYGIKVINNARDNILMANQIAGSANTDLFVDDMTRNTILP